MSIFSSKTFAWLLDLDWANESATGLVCLACGFVHTFTSKVRMWEDDPAA